MDIRKTSNETFDAGEFSRASCTTCTPRGFFRIAVDSLTGFGYAELEALRGLKSPA